MKPNFALCLSSDGVRLLHRTPKRWHVVGEVALDDPDFPAALADLRNSAKALEPRTIRSKIVIPDDQIRYMTLPDPQADAGDVRLALDGATPYSVEDLVYDFTAEGGVTLVAAVARETLAEAQQFARENGFGPISFTAAPAPGRFAGEVWFGGAAGLTPSQEQRIKRDDLPVPSDLARLSRRPSEAAAPPEEAADLAPEPEAAAPLPEAEAPAAPPEAATPEDLAAPVTEAAEEAEPQPIPPIEDEGAAPADDADHAPEGAESPAGRAFLDAEDDALPDPARPTPATAGTETADDKVVIEEAEAPPAPEAGAEPESAPGAETETEAGETRPEPEGRSTWVRFDDDPIAPAPKSDNVPPAATLPPDFTARRPPPAPPPEAAIPTEPVFTSRARVVRPDAVAPPRMPPPRLPAAALPDAATDLRPNGADEAGFAHRGPAAPAVAPPLAPPAAAALDRGARPPGSLPPRPEGPAPVVPGAGPKAPVPEVGATLGADLDVPPPRTPVIRPDMPPRLAAALSAAARNAPAADRRPLAPEIAPPRKANPLAGLIPQAKSADPLVPPATVAPPARIADDEAPFTAKPTSGQVPSPATAAATLAPEADERARMTVFGQRAKARPRGKPRYLALILTLLLILVMIAVAAWVSLSETTVSRLMGSDPEAPVALAGSEISAPAEDAAPPAAPEIAAADTAPLLAETLAATDVPAPDAPAPEANDIAPELAAASPESDTGPVPEADTAIVLPRPAPAPSEATGPLPTPDEADRFYASTGVWIRGPRLPLLPEGETLGLLLAASSAPLAYRGGADLPALPASAPDAALVAPPNPPPPGTAFERDERGFILATPEGTVLPDGLVVYAGSPALRPPTRPGTEAPPVQPEAAAAEPEPDPTAPDIVAEPVTEATPGGVALTDLVPPARPEEFDTDQTALDDPPTDLRPPVRPGDLVAEGSGEQLAFVEEVAPQPFDGPRPAPRPAGFVENLPEPEVELAPFGGPRPSPRPAGLAPPPPEPEPEPEPEPVAETIPQPIAAPDVNQALAAIVASASDPLAGATAQAVARAPRPDTRPRNFDRVVARALQQQARTAAAPQGNNPSTVPASGPAVAAAAAPQAEEVDGEDDAPPAPSGTTPTSVAAAATVDDAMNLRQINLIGVFGRPNERRALVRLENGRYVRVAVGDSLDGGQVTAIGDNALNYVRRGRTYLLQIPSG